MLHCKAAFKCGITRVRSGSRLCENSAQSRFQGSLTPWHTHKNVTGAQSERLNGPGI